MYTMAEQIEKLIFVIIKRLSLNYSISANKLTDKVTIYTLNECKRGPQGNSVF